MAKQATIPRRPRTTASAGLSDFQKELNDMIRTAQADARVTLTNGIMIQTKPLSQDAIRRTIGVVPKPKIPIVFIESRDREEENPNDPEYLDALEKYNTEILTRVYKTMLVLGTHCHTVPSNEYLPESDEWIQLLAVAGVEAKFENQFERYHEWLTLYACTSQFDYNHLTSVLYRRVGVMEKEVIDAIEFFQRIENGRAAIELSPEDPEFWSGSTPDDTGDSNGDGGAGLSEILPDTVDGIPEDVSRGEG